MILLYSTAAMPIPERAISFDIGAGVPQLAALGGQVTLLDWFQLGFGYGLMTSSWVGLPSITLPTESISFAEGGNFFVQGQVSATVNNYSLSSISPYIRFFPTERNFYIQFMYTILQASTGLSANLQALGEQFDNALQVSATFTQAIPTLSIGHIFSGALYFINFNLGVSLISTSSVSVDVGGNVPDSLGGTAANQAALNKIAADIQSDTQQAADKAKNPTTIIPSLYVSFGFIF